MSGYEGFVLPGNLSEQQHRDKLLFNVTQTDISSIT